MYRFLLTRQWVILTLVGLIMIPAMAKLGFWQLHRHEHRVAQNQIIADGVNARPVPVGKLTSPGHHVPHRDMWRPVRATGSYDAEHEVVVRYRTGSDEQSQGYYVLTPLVMADHRVALVNRGWIPADGDLTQYPKVPTVPAGVVTVTGRLMADETSAGSGIKDKQGLPPRQVMLIDSAKQAKAIRQPVLGGYIELTGTTPKPSRQPDPVPAPDHSSIGPHMAYAVQWWLFAGAVPVGWFILVRRERRDRTAAATAAATSPAEPATTGNADGSTDTAAPEVTDPATAPEIA
ncbi:SURF1 family cytochrome oxidase biogenesis protein [Streptomyces sp. H27-D2]|uniref:SURF1 family cytochrome oxidase biogenesis protein n=1 Tax=Streptomyces sp. H27-D2 TaxID=3046304 RepID=UPI002DB84174|nr:SURF1 family protein [Streptomyces sp. H27-D2]MEC4017720.1 SURF1 family protein [Streptomyces sp. H27-D2]